MSSGEIYRKLANCHPKLQAGDVWCHQCGQHRKVDSAKAFRTGWPKCCGFTMSIDDPASRRALAENGRHG